jgi:hypothetical protein
MMHTLTVAAAVLNQSFQLGERHQAAPPTNAPPALPPWPHR